MRPLALGVVFALLIGVAEIDAHHSFSAYYHEDQLVTIEGELVAFDYRNPHAWVYVLVRDEQGRLQKFGAEWAGTRRLERRGITATTLRPGDRVRIKGSPGRKAQDRILHLKGIQRMGDGWTWGRTE
ncbi:MAG: DUF6152 family protein [Vicinamibacterales bacterium]